MEAMALLVHGGKHMHCTYDKAEWCKVFMCSTSDTKLKKKSLVSILQMTILS